MNLYLLSRPEHLPYDYDDTTEMVVAAESEEAARNTGPRPSVWFPDYRDDWWGEDRASGAWIDADGSEAGGWIPPSEVVVKLIGTAAPGVEAGIVLDHVRYG